jgi:hypothetical protein
MFIEINPAPAHDTQTVCPVFWKAARPRDRNAVRGTEGEIYRGAQAVVATERKVPEGNFFASRRRS